MNTSPADPNNTTRTPRGSRLPSLGRRGEGWVILQVVLLVAIVLVGHRGAPWPSAAHTPLMIIAALLALGGVYLFVGGSTALGRQLTPFPKPVDEGTVRRDGAYRFVRHPIYGGVLLLALAWSLVTSPLALLPWVVAVVFLDTKRRREEAWLVTQHADYADYMQQVRHCFIPGIW